MSDRPATGLFTPRPRSTVLSEGVARARARLDALEETALDALLEDALFHERRRLERARPQPGEHSRLDALARAIVRGGRADRTEAGLALVHAWLDEIHTRFSMRAYRFAFRVIPPAVAALLTAQPRRLRDWKLDITARLDVQGDLPWLRELSQEATLILAPTHVSNLDSPVIGLALALAGLPPFQYGAGLNLFSNPVLGWWMRRLGAYTVDRTKGAQLYKDVLKDYSVQQLQRRHHSLFFPGGTRSRSGAIETEVKKGLLGTGVAAWQDMLAAERPDPDVYIVPMTLSFQLVLEANTLINDFLADAGKQRFIISDDEFSQPRQVAAFFKRVLSMDNSIVCRFGAPLDVLGRPVPRDAADRAEASVYRRRYVTNRDGKVERDEQRDRVYTDRAAAALAKSYPGLATVHPTHLAASVSWELLQRQVGSCDPFRVVRMPAMERRIPHAVWLDAAKGALGRAERGRAEGRWHTALPATAEGLLANAQERFDAYHRSRALHVSGDDVVIEDPKLCLYYRNRATFTEEAP